MKSKNQLTLNVILNFAYEIILLIFPLITTPYISRVLEADGVGIFSYTKSFVTYFSIFAMLGTASYGMRTIALSRENKEEYSKKFWEIELLIIATSSVALLGWLLFSFLYQKYTIYLLIFSIEIINVIFNISWFYKGLEQFKYIVTINLIIRIITIALLFVLVKEKDDLPIYILLNVGSTVLGSISMWIFLPKFINKTKISLHEIISHLKNTFVYFVPAIASSVYTVLDKSLIGIITQDEFENGYYEQATKIIDICKTVCFVSINGVMASRMSYLYSKNDTNGIKSGIKLTMNITLFLSIGALFGVIGISNIFVPLFFGDGYAPTVILMDILVAIVPIICVSNVLSNLFFTPVGMVGKTNVFLIVGAITNLVLNVPLILLFKGIGAVIASIIAELVVTILYLKNSKEIFTLKDLLKILWKKILAGSGMLFSILTINFFLNDLIDLTLLLFIDICLGMAIYFVILLLLKDSLIKAVRFFLKKEEISSDDSFVEENVYKIND